MTSKELINNMICYILKSFNITNKLFYQPQYKTSESIELDDDDNVFLYSCTLSYHDLNVILTSVNIDNFYYLLISYDDFDNLPHVFFEYEEKDNDRATAALTRAPSVLYWLPMSVEQLCLNLSAFEKLKMLNQDFKKTDEKTMKNIAAIFKDALKESYEGKEI